MTQNQKEENPVPQKDGILSTENKKQDRIKDKLKFYGVVAGMACLCLGIIIFIFSPEKSADEDVGGININIPDATVPATESDKRKAIEREQMEQKQADRVRTLFDFDTPAPTFEDEPEQAVAVRAKTANTDAFARSEQAARELNRQMEIFASQPREDPEVEQLRRQVEELSARLEQQSQPHNGQLDELELMERSYQLAAQYLPTGGQQVKQVDSSDKEPESDPFLSAYRASDDVSSTLAEWELTPQPRNYAFVTAVGTQPVSHSNAIRACVSDDQVVTNGAVVKMRLLEPFIAGDHFVPVNTTLYGNVRIDGQRLGIVVTSIEANGNIIPVELTVHDMDGQRGLNVPNSTERTAAKDALASMGQSFGTSISFARSAGQQVAMDLTRGAMTGTSQYISAKMREVKITLKANYQVLLIAKQ